MLVSLTYARVFVIKLYPKRGGGLWVPADQRQRGMRGNVMSFKWNTNRVVDMLEGKITPRPMSILASTIAVTFIGTGKVLKNWLRSTFRVRRQPVHDALVWLKCNNHLWHDVIINPDRVASLPEDAIPIELRANFRQEDDNRVAEKESETYVPINVQTDPGSDSNAAYMPDIHG